MHILSFIVIVISLLIIIFLSIYAPKKVEQFIPVEKLSDYIMGDDKKRKSDDINHKITLNTSKNRQETVYKRLSKVDLNYKLNSRNKLVYVEKNNSKYTKTLLALAPIIQSKINYNDNKYRAIKDECIIETVANSYAHAVLLKDSFNMFESFKNLCSLVKVYKKEAEILSYLVASNLLIIYFKLCDDIVAFKKKIKVGANLKSYKRAKLKDSFVYYGAFMFNPSATKILNNNSDQIICHTNKVLSELEQIENKQKIIYKYITFLYNGIK